MPPNTDILLKWQSLSEVKKGMVISAGLQNIQYDPEVDLERLEDLVGMVITGVLVRSSLSPHKSLAERNQVDLVHSSKSKVKPRLRTTTPSSPGNGKRSPPLSPLSRTAFPDVHDDDASGSITDIGPTPPHIALPTTTTTPSPHSKSPSSSRPPSLLKRAVSNSASEVARNGSPSLYPFGFSTLSPSTGEQGWSRLTID